MKHDAVKVNRRELRRGRWFFSFLAILFVLLEVMLYYWATSGGECYRERGNELSAREGVLPAPRGQIRAKDGRMLAWSELYFDLYLRDITPSSPNYRRLCYELQKDIPNARVPQSYDGYEQLFLVRSNLTPDEVRRIDRLALRHSELKIVRRIERHVNPNGRLREITGSVEIDEDGAMVGISGLEAQYNGLLTGKPGRFTVMLDRHGKWLDETFVVRRQPVAGRDWIVDIESEGDELLPMSAYETVSDGEVLAAGEVIYE